MKKAIILFFLGGFVAAIGLIIWQPDRLKTATFRYLVSRFSPKGYTVALEKVEGNLFGKLTLRDLRVGIIDGPPLAQISELSLNLRWSSLLDKKMVFEDIKIVRPKLELFLTPDRKLLIPPRAAPPAPAVPSDKKEGWELFVKGLEISDGSIEISNPSVLGEEKLKIGRLNLFASLTPEKTSLEKFRMQVREGTAEAKGHFQPGKMTVSVRTDRFPLHEIVSAFAALPRPLRLDQSGTWEINQQHKKWNFKVDGTLNSSPLKLETALEQRRLTGTLVLSELSLQKTLGFHEKGQTAARDLISCDLNFAGLFSQLKKINANGQIQWRSLPGENFPARTGTALLNLTEGAGPLTLNFQAGKNEAQATGHVDLPREKIDLKYSLKAVQLDQLAFLHPFFSKIKGSGKSDGQITGQSKNPAIHAQVQLQEITMADKKAASFNLTFSRNPQDKGKMRIDFSGAGIQFNPKKDAPFNIRELTGNVVGKPAELVPTINTTFANKMFLSLTGLLKRNSKGWAFSWDPGNITIRLPNTQVWGSPEPGRIQVQGKTIEFQTLKLHHDLQVLTLNGEIVPGKRQVVSLKMNNVALGPWVKLQKNNLKVDGLINSTVTLKGLWLVPEGSAEISLTQGYLKDWAYDQILGEVEFKNPWIELKQLKISAQGQYATAVGRIPMEYLRKGSSAQPLTVKVRADQLDPSAFTKLTPALEIEKGGRTDIQLNITGVWPNLKVEGSYFSDIPSLLVKPVGLKLQNLRMNLISSGSNLEVKEFSANTKEGNINLRGRSRLPNLNFILEARNVPFQSQPVWEVKKNEIKLALTGKLNAPRLTGRMEFSDGYFNNAALKEKNKKKKKKTDSEMEKPAPAKTGKPSLWQNLEMDVHVLWPRDFWYRESQSAIETEGNLYGKKNPGQKMFLEGSIKTVRGNYVYQGRNFKLQSGLVTFTGPPDINPLLDISALYRAESVEITLRITGTAQSPELHFVSNPPMSDQDILSILVFGRPVNELRARDPQSEKGQTTQEQIGEVAGGLLGGYLSQKLSESGLVKLDLDLLRIQPSTEGTKLTVGRYIGTNLFISYGQTFAENGARTLSAEYFLTPKWTIQAQVGSNQSSYFDFLFRYPLNKPRGVPDEKIPTIGAAEFLHSLH